jgi:hypothetical protein
MDDDMRLCPSCAIGLQPRSKGGHEILDTPEERLGDLFLGVAVKPFLPGCTQAFLMQQMGDFELDHASLSFLF